MNTLLWVLQVLVALSYCGSGIMKVFMFDKVSADVPSFGAMPRTVWALLGMLELVCAAGLTVPAALHWQPWLTVRAAVVLAVESLVFIGVHVKYRETTARVMSGVLGLVMATGTPSSCVATWTKPLGRSRASRATAWSREA